MNVMTYAFLIIVLTACTTQSSTEASQSASDAVASPVPKKVVSHPAARTFSFDVPALLGKNIDQIEKQLGPSPEEDSHNASSEELEKTYKKEGCKMVITYNTKSRHVEGFFLSAPGPSELTRNCNKLFAAGNLKPRNPLYDVDSLASNKDGYFLGLVITSK